MIKMTAFLTITFCFVSCLSVFTPVHAVSLKLTPEQINEAIEYGQKNKSIDMAAFSGPWLISLGKGKGAATLFTPYHNIAYKARKAAVERREFTNRDIFDALQIGDSLTFSVTVYGDTYDFAMYYSAKLYQGDTVIQPNFEFAPEIADASEFWPDSPSQSARLVFKFPVQNVDLNSLITLVVIAPGGDESAFSFDFAKVK